MMYKLIVIGLLISVGVHAQDATSIASKIEALRANVSITEEKRTAAISLLTEAQQLVERSIERAKAVKGYTATMAGAKTTLNELAAELDRVKQQPATEIPDGVSVNYLDTQLGRLQAEWATLDATLQSLKAREAELLARADNIATEIATARKEVNDLESTSAPPQDESDPVTWASRIKFDAYLAERRAAITDLSAEQITISSRREIVTARLALVNAQLARLADPISQFQERLGESLIGKARAKLKELEGVVAGLADSSDALKKLARENADLAQTLLNLVEREAAQAGDMLLLQQDLTRVTASAQTVDQVLAAGQLNDDTAKLLRNVRKHLPRASRLTEVMSKNSQTMVSIRLNRVLWQDRLRNLTDIEAASKGFLTEYGEPEPTSEVLASAIKLVAQRRDLLQSLSNAARDKADQLSSERLLHDDLLARTTALTSLLDRRLLWLPSTSESEQSLLSNVYSNIVWLASTGSWRATAQAVFTGFATLNHAAIGFAILAVGLALMLSQLRRRLVSLAEFVGNVSKDTYLSTPAALAVSICLALPGPLFLASIGLAAGAGSRANFTLAVSQGLISAAIVLFILSSFRILARENGVFHRHFGWSKQSRTMLRFHLVWFTVVEVLVAFVFTAAEVSGDPVIEHGIGQLAFMISSIAIALFSFHFFKPRGGIALSISTTMPAFPGLKFLYVVLVTLPLAIAIMPFFGYYEAAIALQTRVFESGVILLIAAIVFRLSMRFFFISHRRLMLKRLKEQRKRELEQRETDEEAEQSGDAAPKIISDEVPDLETLSKNSESTVLVILVTVLALGLWSVWGSMLPALGIANEVILWQGTKFVDGLPVTIPVSLLDLVTALLLIGGGFYIARNIGGILELVFFERLNISSGSRYAVVTIAGYLLVGIGIVAGLSRLEVNWSSMQWIIAALGVGLGFGLQEIVANFVSGLIILFERPIRIGDTVTIGQLEGTVTSIKIRATRITDYDNREVLLPNKSIITENVTNWTLSDQVTRIILRVGVAYGSDIDKVRDVILDAVTSHPDTLEKPGPVVFFMSHGDSSLNFEARVFVATPSKRLPVIHDLNRAINMALAKHGIEIPFPQRDLHVRTGQKEPTGLTDT